MRPDLSISVFSLALWLLVAPAFAAESPSPGDACSTAGLQIHTGGPEDPDGNFLVCNGTVWKDFLNYKTTGYVGILQVNPQAPLDVNGEAKIGNTSLACSGTTEGAIRWNTTDNVHEYCNGTVWAKMVPECSAWPDDFSFSNVTGAALSSTQNSAIVQITGVSCGAGADVSITGGGSPQFRTCSDAICSTVVQNWTSTTTAIANNHYLQLRLTASPNSLTILTATVTVGGQARNWSVTTLDAGTFKRAFKTSTTQMGNFGGVAGADAICATRASAAGLGGTWMAWLATDATDDPESRFTQATIPYRRTDGALIANNWTDLTDGTLSNPVECDEFGVCSGYMQAWTNVSANGTATGSQNCTGWTVNSGQGMTGTVHHTGTSWTHDSAYDCNISHNKRLYCFQQ